MCCHKTSDPCRSREGGKSYPPVPWPALLRHKRWRGAIAPDYIGFLRPEIWKRVLVLSFLATTATTPSWRLLASGVRQDKLGNCFPEFRMRFRKCADQGYSHCHLPG
ncbi:hypothetical protein BO70DRAFT_2985 [Aspergillus heteromorphus CBS 117.55]|uniref:Uncharacterized protein n=1 Tax=Aspergillus heteromorphus CBS 117.55 TaxID=1448321 RepID=A0A317X3N6_9EURO|nr:uncharacterized protein BO70DRAFT_2985 [Aspergillus heteromorphus CBS 117.55]PWY92117.1 hypothetical protein BO70DRAFT_2985 [Aspergillus heteromorphus CBS 117.55]